MITEAAVLFNINEPLRHIKNDNLSHSSDLYIGSSFEYPMNLNDSV